MEVEFDPRGSVGGAEGVVLGCCEGVAQFGCVVGSGVFGNDEVEVCFDGEGFWGAWFEFSEFLLGTEFAVDGLKGLVGTFGVAERDVDGSATTADGHVM